MKFLTYTMLLASISGIHLKKEETETTEEPEAPSFNLKVTSFGDKAGNTCKAGDSASVNYTGKFKDGKVFDSNLKSSNPEPFKFTIGANMVIKCWD